MTTTTKTTHVQKHYFRELPPFRVDGQTKPSEIASCAETPEKALAHCSGGDEQWAYVRTEELPYVHAERAHAIADALPGDWEAKPQSEEHPESGWYLQRADGLRLFLSPPGCHNRTAFGVSLSGRSRKNGPQYVEVYDDKGQRVCHPSINVGATKEPAQMAKDIDRRLLADAERVHKLIEEKLAGEGEYERLKLEALREFCAAVKIEMPTDYHSHAPRFTDYAGKMEFMVNTGDSIDLKFRSLRRADAIALAHLAKTAGLLK